MAFTPRLTKPTDKNKYYIRKTDGGYSPCIAGKPQDGVLTALANCVGWAVGRFNEIGGYGCCKYLGSTNAENFVTLAKSQGLTVQSKPTLGGVMVWSKGKVGNGADGAGHVAVVEQINGDGSVLTSESGYKYRVFYTTKRSGANWGQNSDYTYLGCIVNPAVKEDTEMIPAEAIRKGDIGAGVKWMQTKLCIHGYLRSTEIDGDFGRITLGALLAFQFENGLAVDGVCGPKTKAKL